MCLHCVLNATEDTEGRAAKGSVHIELRPRIHGKAGCTIHPHRLWGDKRTPGASLTPTPGSQWGDSRLMRDCFKERSGETKKPKAFIYNSESLPHPTSPHSTKKNHRKTKFLAGGEGVQGMDSNTHEKGIQELIM